jgi:hypothetical protein
MKETPLTQSAVCGKEKSLFDGIKQKEGGDDTFRASKGWFTNFKQRTKVKLTGEIAGASEEVGRAYHEHFRQLVDEGKYPPALLFSMEETSL